MKSGSNKTEAEEENAPIDGSGAGGTRPVNMDYDWGEGETGVKPTGGKNDGTRLGERGRSGDGRGSNRVRLSGSRINSTPGIGGIGTIPLNVALLTAVHTVSFKGTILGLM